jgi:hypothetical protein
LNQPGIEWSMLPTLHEGSEGRYEVTPLMTPKSVTPWARTLLHHREIHDGPNSFSFKL